MSLGEDSGYREDVLRDLNTRAETIHSELQSAGAPEYPSTTVDPMDVQDRRDIGEYLTRESGLDYCSSLHIIKQLGMIYREDEDRYIVTDAALDPESSSNEYALLAHEAGHRLGRKVIEDRLAPLKQVETVSDEAFDTLANYLLSENFAERFKVAAGESVGMNFSYDERFLDGDPDGYELRARIGPEELVDPGRDEDLEVLLMDVERLVDHLSSGIEEWS